MRSRVFLAALTAGFVGCTGSNLLAGYTNPLGGSGPSSIIINVGDSAAVPAYRPSFDTVATSDTVEFSVAAGDPDAPYNITWDGAPAGAHLPPNSGDLQDGQTWDAPALTTAGYYSYHDSHHANMAGTLFVLMAVNNARRPDR